MPRKKKPVTPDELLANPTDQELYERWQREERERVEQYVEQTEQKND